MHSCLTLSSLSVWKRKESRKREREEGRKKDRKREGRERRKEGKKVEKERK